jgi:hypothetical protein
MAKISSMRDKHTGATRFKVEWEDNDGVGGERTFESRNAAERYALNAEVRLFNDAVQRLIEGMAVQRAQNQGHHQKRQS